MSIRTQIQLDVCGVMEFILFVLTTSLFKNSASLVNKNTSLCTATESAILVQGLFDLLIQITIVSWQLAKKQNKDKNNPVKLCIMLPRTNNI